jgi:uncharacterized protein YdaU (DUF1376 family)
MNRIPYFKFFPSDWLGSSERAMMTPAEEGGYISLLCHAWASEDCGLPDDDAILGKLSRIKRFSKSKMKIMSCFYKSNNRWYNKRLLELREEAISKREKKSYAGKISAEHRKKDKDDTSTPVQQTLKLNSTGVPPFPEPEPEVQMPEDFKPPEAAVLKSKEKDNSPNGVKVFIDTFRELNPGSSDPIITGKEAAACKKLSQKYKTAEKLKEIFNNWLRSTDTFVVSSGYNPALLLSRTMVYEQTNDPRTIQTKKADPYKTTVPIHLFDKDGKPPTIERPITRKTDE